MKKNIITLLLLSLFIPGFSQSSMDVSNERLNLSVKKSKLNSAKFITDIAPELWHKLNLPSKERTELDERRKIYYPLGYYIYPQGGYTIIIDYISVEISATCNGKTLRSQSRNDILTPEQKNSINDADLGTDISIKIKFRYKESPCSAEIIEGGLAVTVVPETEAEFPGGYKQLTHYLMENVIDKIPVKNIGQAIVKFTVNEEGQIVDAKISGTRADPKANKLLLDAIDKMPKWKPAENLKGTKIKQKYCIPFGDGC